MYGDDYSDLPGFFTCLMALGAAGGLGLGLVVEDRSRRRLLAAWCATPVLAVIALVVALNRENLTPALALYVAPVVSTILLIPWLMAVLPTYVIARAVVSRFASRRAG